MSTEQLPDVETPKSRPASADLFLMEQARGEDSRFTFVDLPPRQVVTEGGEGEVVFLRLKIKRVDSGAPIYAGIPDLLAPLHSVVDDDEDSPKGKRSKVTEDDAKILMERFEHTALAAACTAVIAIWDGSHEAGGEEPTIHSKAWKPLRLVMPRGRFDSHDPANGVWCVDRLNLPERIALGKAVVEHSTGQGVGTIRSLLFRLSRALLPHFAAFSALRAHALRSLEDEPSGEGSGGGDHPERAGGSEPSHAEGEVQGRSPERAPDGDHSEG